MTHIHWIVALPALLAAMVGVTRECHGAGEKVVVEAERRIDPQTGILWLDCHPAGSELVSTSTTLMVDVLSVQDLVSTKRLRKRGIQAAFSPSGKEVILSTPGDQISVLDAKTEKDLLTFSGGSDFRVSHKLNAIGFRGEGDFDKNAVWLLDLKSMMVNRHWTIGDIATFYPFSRSDVVAINCGDYKSVLISTPPYRKAPARWAVGKYVREMHVSPDGKTAALGTGENSVELWDVVKGSKLRTLHRFAADKGEVTGLLFSDDGEFLLGLGAGEGRTTEVIVWDTESYGEVTRSSAHQGPAFGLTWFSDSRRFATGGQGDGIVKIWKITTSEAE